GELNPCPRRCPRSHLHAYPALRFREPTLHRRTAASRVSAKFLHRPTRSLRRPISLLSTFGAVAGVQLQTSRSIKPRERDLGDLRLFVLVRFFTRPTNRPRHAACVSNDESKPVRPLSFKYTITCSVRNLGRMCKLRWNRLMFSLSVSRNSSCHRTSISCRSRNRVFRFSL